MKKLLYILTFVTQVSFGQVLTNINGDVIAQSNVLMANLETATFYSNQSGTINQITITLKIDAGKTIQIDWGNGVISSVTGTGSSEAISSNYIYSNKTYRIQLYGNLESVRIFSLNESKFKILSLTEISKFTGLKELLLTNCTLNSGTIADLPSGLTYLYWYDLSGLTVTGTIADLPSGLTYLYWRTLSGLTVTGTIADLPSGLTSLICIALSGLTVTGTIDQFPQSINNILLVQSCVNIDIGYVGATIPAWATVAITFQNAWTTTELDDFLINWASTAGTGTRTITLAGDNAARSSASDAAVITLEGKGKTIVTN